MNVTDGRSTYHRYPPDLKRQEIYQYTVMPTHLAAPFSPEELSQATSRRPSASPRARKLLKVPVSERSAMYDNYGPGALLEDETRLYDLETDPGQLSPLADAGREAEMARLMRRLMLANEAPPEAFARLGLPPEDETA